MALSRKAPLKRGESELKRGPGPQSRTRMRTVNRKRIASLRAVQFGVDGYREHVIMSPCLVTGRPGPNDPAHILKTRAAGGGPEHMGPLRSDVHTSFDSMGEVRFMARYGVKKDEVRTKCVAFRAEWDARSQTTN